MATEAQIFQAVDAYRQGRLDLRTAVAERDAAVVLRNDALARLQALQANVTAAQTVVDQARVVLKGLLNEA